LQGHDGKDPILADFCLAEGMGGTIGYSGQTERKTEREIRDAFLGWGTQKGSHLRPRPDAADDNDRWEDLPYGLLEGGFQVGVQMCSEVNAHRPIAT